MIKKRFENRLNKSDIKFNTLNPVWDNERGTALNVFEMIEEMNELHDENNILKASNGEYEDALARLEEENEQLKSDNNRLVNETAKVVAEHQSKVFNLINAKIKLYSHKPISAPISQPMSVNFDADVDRLARLSELEALKEELQE